MATDDDLPWHVPLMPCYGQCGMTPAAQKVLHALCWFARRKCYCWPSNEMIAELARMPLGSVRRGTAELVRCGVVERVMEDGSRPERIGFLLVVRPDGAFYPMAVGPAGLHAATEALKRDRKAWASSRRPRRGRSPVGV
jgi:Helix-turn-helix domain